LLHIKIFFPIRLNSFSPRPSHFAFVVRVLIILSLGNRLSRVHIHHFLHLLMLRNVSIWWLLRTIRVHLFSRWGPWLIFSRLWREALIVTALIRANLPWFALRANLRANNFFDLHCKLSDLFQLWLIFAIPRKFLLDFAVNRLWI
jgi:hypothetical protein